MGFLLSIFSAVEYGFRQFIQSIGGWLGATLFLLSLGIVVWALWVWLVRQK